MVAPEHPPATLPFETHHHQGRVTLDPVKITSELNRLWEESSAGLADGQAYTRVSLLDLVVVADVATLQKAESMILRIARERPSRTILICVENENDSESAGELSAEVGIACSLGEGSRGVLCWEKITIFATARSLKFAPGAVRSLLSGFNPVVVVDLLPSVEGEETLSELYHLSDYVFFDSSINRRKIAAKVEAQDGDFEKLFDLGYERDHPLREAVKRVFDEPKALGCLSKLSSVNITYPATTPGAKSRALYLCGWLASKLKLTLRSVTNRQERLYTDPAGKNVIIRSTVSPFAKSERYNSIGIVFEFSDDCPAIRVTPLETQVEADSNTGVVSHSVQGLGGSDDIDLVVRDMTLHDAQYILRRLSDSHRRGDYTAALSRALEILHLSNQTEMSSEPQVMSYPDKQRLTQGAAELFVSIMREAVRERGRFVVSLAGGSTPVALYRLLSGSVYADCPEWSESLFLFGDERSAPPDHPDSNYRMAKENLFDPLGILPHQVLRMEGESDDLEQAAESYQRLIEKMIPERDMTGTPVMDLALLGLGDDGHTASIFPDYPADSVDESALCVSVWVASKKTHRLTLTPRMLNSSRNVVFLVSGSSKAAAVRALLVDKTAAASRIQPKRGRMYCLLDSDAAMERAEV